MTRIEKIKEKLSNLKILYCEIVDETDKHSNHFNGGTETHLKLNIAAELLSGKNTLMQHRMIYSLLEDEFQEGLHALSINIVNHF